MSKGRPIWLYLALFGVAILIPALIGSGYVLHRYAQAEREVDRVRFLGRAELLADHLDRELSNSLTILRVFAASQDLDRADFAAFHERVSTALEDTGFFVLLLEPSRQQLLNTRVPYGTKLGLSSDPKTPAAAFRDGLPQVSDVFLGKVAGEPVVNVTMPVKRGDAVPYVLLLTRNVDGLLSAITGTNAIAEVLITVVDSENRIIARSSDHDSFVTRPLPSALAAGVRGDHGVAEVQNDDGTVLLLAHRSLREADWRVILTSPLADVEAALTASLGWLVATGAGLLVLSLSSAYVIGHYIASPMRKLAEQARAVGERRPMRTLDSHLLEANAVSTILTRASEEREARERHIGLLVDEMRHRARNQFSVIQALTDLTARHSDDLDDFQRRFLPRVRSLSASLELLTSDEWQMTDIERLVRAQTGPFASIGKRFEIDGPLIRVDSDAAQSLGLALHELGTNATKYGALSTAAGRVAIRWGEDRAEEQDEAMFWMLWEESGGPAVRPPARTGFGTTIRDRMLSQSTDGTVSVDFPPSGLVWRFECAAANLTKG